MRLEWRRSGTELDLKFTVSGTTKTRDNIKIQADSQDIGRLVFGNVDGLSTFGGTPRIYFRSIQWGKL